MNRKERRFADLLREHGPGLGRIAASYARPADQDDLRQEISIAIWNALDRFRGDCSARTFLFRIAHNRGLSHVARRRIAGEELPAIADQAPGPEARVAGMEEVEQLFTALRALPVSQGQVLTLVLSEDERTGGVMSDEEWQRWAATYAKEVRPIPPVIARARTDRRRAFIGLTLVYVIAALLLMSELQNLRHAHTIVASASSLFTMVSLLAIVVGMHGATWGMLTQTGSAPLQLLADLEQRHARRRRLLRLMPWLTGFIVCGTIGFEAASMISADRFDLPAAFETLAVCGVTVALVWWTVKRVGNLIDRELRQAAEARRLLIEGDDTV